jgi:hypothetical protein
MGRWDRLASRADAFIGLIGLRGRRGSVWSRQRPHDRGVRASRDGRHRGLRAQGQAPEATALTPGSRQHALASSQSLR